MTPQNIIAAWKNRQFRMGLNPEQLGQLPQNPAGAVELTAKDIEAVVGAAPESLRDVVCHTVDAPECYPTKFFPCTFIHCSNTVGNSC
jgi:mersacidin/lichenicidin family type 2 lantibiotic